MYNSRVQTFGHMSEGKNIYFTEITTDYNNYHTILLFLFVDSENGVLYGQMATR